MLRFLLISFFIVTCWSANAFAWDFSCSPKETTEIIQSVPPNVLMMLDRSGSMDSGSVAGTCKVCESAAGNQFEVQSASDCISGGTPWSVYGSSWRSYQSYGSGAVYNIILNVPTATADIELDMQFFGDFGNWCERADIYVDGDYQGTFDGTGSDCRSSGWSDSFIIDAAYANDGIVNLNVVTTPDGNNCNGDGVDLFCGTNGVEVTAIHQVNTYYGSVQNGSVCGYQDKWDQAVAAIEAVTSFSDAQQPELAYFGLGLFHGDSTATIENDCAPTNASPISTSLGSTGPDGSTPTAQAILTSLGSGCIQGSWVEETINQNTPQNSNNKGYDFTYRFNNLPTTVDSVELEIELDGDFGGSCELVEVYADGNLVGIIGDMGDDCTSQTDTVTVPAVLFNDGELTILLDSRADGETLGSCSGSDDGVEARCSDNEMNVTLRYLPTNAAPLAAATILINDGEPTRTLNSGSSGSAYQDAVIAACAHREQTSLYILGLGSGTDEDFNNILAAAGGTGTCIVNGNDVDPCDSPSDYSSLRGDCTGSFQTDNEQGLIDAIAAITSDLSCVYPINFSGSPVVEVPEDASYDYDYLYVDFVDDSGQTNRIYHAQSQYSTNGEGWEFSGNPRVAIQFTNGMCDNVQIGGVRQVATQLACMCEEQTGSACTVPNAEALGVCPTGTWACYEGVDVCEPTNDCCVAGNSCTIPGEQGICAEGLTVCNGTVETCEPINTAETEVCDGEDNDCDGMVDEIDGECSVPGQVGRCAAGSLACQDLGGAYAEVCVQQFGPMPEMCNGIDDDCDGTTDNLMESWEKSQFDQYQLQDEGKACLYQNICQCPNGAETPAGYDFTTYESSYTGQCGCGGSLDADVEENVSSEESVSEPTHGSESSAACSTAPNGGSPVNLWWMLLPLVMVGRRRRKK